MRLGMFSIIALAAMCCLFVGIILSLGPSIGGSIEEAGDSALMYTDTWNTTTGASVTLDYYPLTKYTVYNATYTATETTDYTINTATGAIAKVIGGGLVNNTVYNIDYIHSSFSGATTGWQDGGDFFAANIVWIGLVFLGICAGIVLKVIMG